MYKSQQKIPKHTKQQGHSDQAKEWNQSLETDPKNTCVSEFPDKVSIHQEDSTTIKLYALEFLNTWIKLGKLEWETDSSTISEENFSTFIFNNG